MSSLKIKALFFCVISIFILSAGFVFAQRPLEVPLPGLEVEGLPLLPDYVKYIFNFSLGISGLIVFGALIYGGIRYLTSAGNPSAIGDAKNRIYSAGIGLLVLLGSWLILTTINPQLVVINPQAGSPGLIAQGLPGVFLCENSNSALDSAECQFFLASSAKLDSFDDKAGYIRFQNSDGVQYGAVLHENAYFKGTCDVFIGEGEVAMPNGRVSSMTLFKMYDRAAGGAGITVYEDEEYGGGHKDLSAVSGMVNEYNSMSAVGPGPIGLYDGCEPGWPGPTCKLEDTISSVKVYDGTMAVLFGDMDFGGKCAVLFNDVSALRPTELGDDQISSAKVLIASP